MPYKRMVNFYQTRSERAMAQIARQERELLQLAETKQEIFRHKEQVNLAISQIWEGENAIAMVRNVFFTRKRKEALLLSRRHELDLRLTQIQEEQVILGEQKRGLIRLRARFERKKSKWMLSQGRVRKAQSMKELHLDEQQVEECAIWKV